MFRLKSIRWIARGTGVQSWEIIANNLKKAGWSWGCVSAMDCKGRTIWIVDALAAESVSLSGRMKN